LSATDLRKKSVYISVTVGLASESFLCNRVVGHVS